MRRKRHITYCTKMICVTISTIAWSASHRRQPKAWFVGSSAQRCSLPKRPQGEATHEGKRQICSGGAVWRRKRWRKGFSLVKNNQKAFAEASDPANVLLSFSFSPYSKTPKPPRTNDASLTQDTLNMRRNSKALPWVCRTRGGEPCVVFVGEDRATAMFVSLSVSWSERFPFGGMAVWRYGSGTRSYSILSVNTRR